MAESVSLDALVVSINGDISKLQGKLKHARKLVQVFADDVQSSGKSIDLARPMDSLVAKSGGITRALGPITAGIAAIGAAAVYTGSKVIDSATAFESLEASLITATGSAAMASEKFLELQQFAAKTPFALDEVTSGFIKLKNLGLDPSERALAAYGNTAGAMGKSLNSMIEAVADAAMGEFERLKEFGIKASSNGDKVTFMFRGVRTEIEKESDAIQGYLMRLAETNFADGMALQAQTMGGVISNLSDNFEIFFNRAAEKLGITELIKTSLEAISNKLGEWNKELRELSPLEDAIELNKEYEKELANVEHRLTSGIYVTQLQKEALEQQAESIRENIEIVKEEIGILQKEEEARKASAKAAEDAAEQEKENSRKKEAAQKVADKLASERKQIESGAQNKIADLERELTLMDERNELIRMQYELEKGEFALASEASKKRLADLAAEIELRRVQQEMDDFHNDRLEREARDADDRNRMREEQQQRNKQDLDDLFEWDKLTQERRVEMSKNSAGMMADWEKRSMLNRVGFVSKGLGNIFTQMSTHSKKAFNLNKMVGRANAIVNTAEGITAAMDTKPFFPLGLAMMAIAAATGAAQLMAINSASFGGGTTPSGPSGSGGAAGGAIGGGLADVGGGDSGAPTRSPAQVTVNINGDINGEPTYEWTARLAERLSELIGDGRTLA